MATLKFNLDKFHPKKDGSITIRLAVCHKGQTSFIATRFSLSSEKQWMNGMVTKRNDASQINMKLRGILDKYQDTLDKIPNQHLYNSKQLKDLLIKRCDGGVSRTFGKTADEYIQSLKKEARSSYADMLDLSKRYFNDYIGEILLSDITPVTVQGFKRWLEENTDAGTNTINKYLSHAKVIINYAIQMQYVTYHTHPYATTRISKSSIKEVDLSMNTMLAIKDCNPPSKRTMVARDLFMLSFYLGGMNLADLMSIKLKGLDELEYSRIKTKRSAGAVKVTVPIVEPAKEIIQKWSNKNTGRLDLGLTGSYKTIRRYVDDGIKKLSKYLGIEEYIVFYSARKTFSQFAADLGIPNSIIDYCLCHSATDKGTISYYKKVKKQQAAIAINRVVDYLHNPDKYKDFLELKSEIMMAKL